MPFRTSLMLAGAFLLAGGGVATAPALATTEAAVTIKPDIAAAVAAPTRTASNVARDTYRHPAETLSFFGVSGNQTVVEYFPSGGWYLEILAPLAAKGGGTYYGVQPGGQGRQSTEKLIASNSALYGGVKLVELTEVPDGAADTVLTFRNVHNMVMRGNGGEIFGQFFRMLKPGGVLGVVDHRLPEDRDTAAEKTSGYLKVSTVRKLAEDAGFVLEASSDVNANPRDTADWATGVWTLPPTLRNGAVDRDKYLAVGESDRMTLRFRKPG
ncbi:MULTISPECIES: class I SAM-dependent methyltransferase [unclassified Sphingobium]|uniref:class I SAM-dependent methyltransferase n=1 Tax=unclassified Sphingobium TaxID=2611147 RepID=UPI002224F61A|nr:MULTISPECIES: methyltransferase [unclassified Sphingobium]MCW2396200.1 putative methyltransferase [Sphingobium sp. B8D3B]MCW2419716.1 putative methyltransferase [Sphingobium sp. B8D3C]